MSEIIFSKEYCSNVFDGTHDSPKPCEIGVPLITSKNIVNGCLDFNGAYNISVEDYNTIQKRSAVSKWDIIFSMIGSVGEVYLEKNDNINYAIKNVGVLSCKDEYKAKWLYYYLKTPFAKSYIKYSLAGAVQKFLSLGKLRDFPIFQYDITKNKNLDFLSALDDKIELNNRINAELEAMAKTLYDYWFVQFDFPNEEAKPYKSSGGKMVYNETLKREIPKGWEVKKLEEIEEKIVTGKTPSTKVSEYFNGNIPFITIDDIRKQFYVYNAERNLTILGAESQANKYVYSGDICVSCIGTIGIIGIVATTSQTNQQINTISQIKDYNRYFLLNSLKNYFEYNVGAKKGAVLDNMNKQEFSNIPILDANRNLKKLYFDKVNPIYEKIKLNLKQNQELSALRDWLLPMLMNGQVKVG